MPWIAKYGGEEKTPRQVPRGEDVECVTCGDRMRVWSRSSDGRARHFKHIGNMGHGEGGDYEGCESVSESQQHKQDVIELFTYSTALSCSFFRHKNRYCS